MFDRKAPSSLRVIAQLETPGVEKALLRIAMWRTPDVATAEDLVANALMRVMDPEDRPWDPAKGTFLNHMNEVMRHVWGRQMRARSSQELADDGIAIDKKTLSREPAADDALDRRRSLEVLEEKTRRLLAVAEEKNPLAKQCLELAMRGTTDHQEQADVLRCSLDEVYEANRFLKRHGKRINDEWEASEQARMRGLREAAMKKKEEGRP